MNGVAIGKSRVARRRGTRTLRPMIEVMEDRVLLATFTVTNNADSGPGSLRQAILNANTAPGKDTINFNIKVGAISDFQLPVGTFSPTNDFPFGITAGPNNTVWFTESGVDQVGAINTGTSAINSSEALPVDSLPVGVAIDGNGNIWVTEGAFDSNRVQEINPVTGALVGAPIFLTGFSPLGITLGPDGNMYVAEPRPSSSSTRLRRSARRPTPASGPRSPSRPAVRPGDHERRRLPLGHQLRGGHGPRDQPDDPRPRRGPDHPPARQCARGDHGGPGRQHLVHRARYEPDRGDQHGDRHPHHRGLPPARHRGRQCSHWNHGGPGRQHLVHRIWCQPDRSDQSRHRRDHGIPDPHAQQRAHGDHGGPGRQRLVHRT